MTRRLHIYADAAERDDVISRYLLGVISHQGLGTRIDLDDASRHFKIAADMKQGWA